MIIEIKPRQSGKTNYIIEQANKHENSIVITYSIMERKRLSRKVKNVICYKDGGLSWSEFDYLYFDECFLMDNLPMDFLHYLSETRHIYMVGTSHNNFDTNMLNYIKKYYPEHLL
jgi:hypothetical protein